MQITINVPDEALERILGIPARPDSDVVGVVKRKRIALADLEAGDRVDIQYVKRNGEIRSYVEVPVLRIDPYVGDRGIWSVMVEDPVTLEPRCLLANGIVAAHRYEVEAVA